MRTLTYTLSALSAFALIAALNSATVYAGCGACGPTAQPAACAAKTECPDADACADAGKCLAKGAACEADTATCCTPDGSCKPDGSDCGGEAKTAEHGEELTPAQLSSLIGSSPDLIILDARSGKYDDGRRIPGAKQLSASSNPDEVAAAIPDKDATIVTYCGSTSCPASSTLAAQLKKLGYSHVHEMPEGIKGWSEAGLPVDAPN